ncbi:MAG: hypothetical protein IPL53_21385 [Ignavibacteria bacterium]|nr:hypothetical protein [Ignavibacteria bacterium]
MKIGLVVREALDTDSNINTVDGNIQIDGLFRMIINPFDEYAIEEALKYKDINPLTEIVSFSAGLKRIEEVIRNAMGMGLDRSFYVQMENGLLQNELCIKGISYLIKKEQPDLIILGSIDIDRNDWSLGPMIAEQLNWPCVTNIIGIEWEQAVRVTKLADGGLREVYELGKPYVICVTKGINQPRVPNLERNNGRPKKGDYNNSLGSNSERRYKNRKI